MSQSALAQKAGLPQPNLSDVERGEREVSLRTLRALALALSIKPGVLADGIGPEAQEAPPALSRGRLERIAEAVALNGALSDPQESALAEKMALLTLARRRAQDGPGHKGLSRRKSRKSGRENRAWLSVAAAYAAPEIQSLVERISEKAAAHQNPQKGQGPKGNP